jgi:hypothetical protein
MEYIAIYEIQKQVCDYMGDLGVSLSEYSVPRGPFVSKIKATVLQK